MLYEEVVGQELGRKLMGRWFTGHLRLKSALFLAYCRYEEANMLKTSTNPEN